MAFPAILGIPKEMKSVTEETSVLPCSLQHIHNYQEWKQLKCPPAYEYKENVVPYTQQNTTHPLKRRKFWQSSQHGWN
jgi:hypothetical protein